MPTIRDVLYPFLPVDRSGYQHLDGSLKIVDWAADGGARVPQSDDSATGGHSFTHSHYLRVSTAPLPVTMLGAPATALPLVTNGALGVDLIRLGAG